jgi:lipopolysaccharide biosynthesis regulator YciM
MIKFITIILIVLHPLFFFAQTNSNVELAADYFQNKEYDKAAELYAQLFEQTNAKVYLTFLFDCYTAQQKFNDAEKLIKKQIKKNTNELSYQVLLSKLYKLEGNTDKAKQTITKTLDKLPADQQEIISLANALEQDHDFESATAVYEKGQKLMGKNYGFHLELANIYQTTKSFKKMSDEYIIQLEETPEYLIPIENRLQLLMQNDLENNVGESLKNALLTRIQTNSKSIELSQLLIWLFIQDKDFAPAIIQAKGIDRRTGNGNDLLMQIGEIALSNNNFDAAISAFEYLKDKGSQTSFFYKAECNYLLSLNRKILINPNHTKNEELELETQLKQAIQIYGINHETVALQIDLAHLLTHYIHKNDEAIAQLETSLQSNNLSIDDKSDIRMELGDTYLYSGNVWDANLVYAKIENDKQGAPISNEAKFKRAKIAYYIGDFKWSSALLDILKAATSKETSNDAFELALLISDNTQDDSLGNAMKLFSTADYLCAQDKDSLAIVTYDSIPKLYPGNQLEDDILFRKAKIYESKNLIDSAITYYQQVATRFSYEIYGDDAIYALGILFETKKNDPAKAMDYYKQIISNFGNSIYVFDSRIRYRKLRGEVK